MDLSDFRNEYLQGSLHRKDLLAHPMKQFERWFAQATELKVYEPNAISLATVNAQGEPSLRTVLVKYVDEKGFVFFTNYESQKAHDIEENPHAALMFPWLTLERQVIARGRVEKISRMESLKYFLSRPKDSQLGAWVSAQSSVISSRSLLESKLAEIKRKFTGGEIPIPSFWGGYRVIPEKMEFWQGGAGRLHDRFLYTKVEGSDDWTIERLAP